jgi:hypothetical protein
MAAVATHTPALAVDRKEAAEMLGLSVDSFERHVFPRLRVVRAGRRVLVPVAEIERYLTENAA